MNSMPESTRGLPEAAVSGRDFASTPGLHSSILIKRLGRVDYLAAWEAMKGFTAARRADTPDEIWLLEHPPVYTVGLSGRPEHFPESTDIPLIKIDRGGQITYHGPGQLVAYLLLDLKRLKLGVKDLVRKMEQAVVDLLAEHGIEARGRPAAPGVYVGEAKIASLGLRVKNGCCYHGLALNVDMDLAPFSSIDPCGYPGLKVIQTRELGIPDSVAVLGEKLAARLIHLLERRP